MQQREERRAAVPILPPEYDYEIESDGLTVYVPEAESDERTSVLHFGPGWTVEAVEDAVYDYDRDLLNFGERFFALWRDLFPEKLPTEM